MSTPASHAQVVISQSTATAQSLDILAGSSGTSEARIAPGATVSANAFAALTGTTRPWSLLNEGRIAAPQGLILAGGATITNLGSIAGTETDPTAFAIAVSVNGRATVDNSGTITTTQGVPGIGINISGGTVVNRAGAVIDVGGFPGPFSGSTPSTSIGIRGADSVVNGGTITARTAVAGAGSVLNQASGVLRGSVSGTSILNEGVIVGSVFGSAITNSGSITGTVFLDSGGDRTLTNAGTISTPFIGFGSGNDTLVLQRGSVINGSVNGGLGENTLILEGASLTNATQFSAFGDRVTVRGTGSSIDGDFAFNQITVQGGLLVTRTLTSPVSLATGGHLQVGAEGQTGARVLGAVNIAGGTLSGHGSITGAVSNTGGTVAPGGSIGTLAVNGNFAQGTSGTLAIEVSPAAASKLAVNGTAAVAGTLAIMAQPGAFTNGARYQILTATGGFSGTFDQTTLTSSSPLLNFGVSYLPNEIDITLQLGSVAGLGGTANQRSVGVAVDALALTPAFAPVIGALTSLSSSAQVQNAIDQIGTAAEGFGATALTALGTSRSLAGVLIQQLSLTHPGGGATVVAHNPLAARVQLASLNPLLPEGPSPWSAWANGFGVFGGVGGDTNAHAVDYSTGGVAFGVDRLISPSLLLGAAAAFAGTGTRAEGLPGSGNVRSYSLGAYASWAHDRLYVDGMLGYAYNDIQLTRDVALPGLAAQAKGDTHGHQFLSSLEVGRTYAIAHGMAATPFAGLTVTTLQQAGFVESGAGVLNLAVDGETTSSVRTMLGSRFGADVEPMDGLMLHTTFKLGWAHEFADTDQVVQARFAAAPAASFTVRGAQARRDSALIGLGIASQLDRSTSLYLAYEGEINGHDDAHAIVGSIRINW